MATKYIPEEVIVSDTGSFAPVGVRSSLIIGSKV